MPIVDLRFDNESARDIHLLRGQSSRSLLLPGGLQFDPRDDPDQPVWASEYLANHSDVRIEFRPVFRYANNGTEYYGFGIRVNQRTGVVSTDPPPAPSPRVDNFLVEVVVLQNDGGLPPAELDVLSVRVHLHESVLHFWLTPTDLTVRRLTPAGAELTRFRFTARAEFDDHTVGDVTVHHGLAWTDPAFVRPDDAAVTAVENDGLRGRIRIPATLAVGAPPATITATLPAAWGGAAATATFRVAAPWEADATRPRVD